MVATYCFRIMVQKSFWRAIPATYPYLAPWLCICVPSLLCSRNNPFASVVSGPPLDASKAMEWVNHMMTLSHAGASNRGSHFLLYPPSHEPPGGGGCRLSSFGDNAFPKQIFRGVLGPKGQVGGFALCRTIQISLSVVLRTTVLWMNALGGYSSASRAI
jgi:hypothetical protein